ncbi:MAG: TlpA family protein disulfide reductase [Flavobacterium sp.]|nr:TlpA family protein disulfide reductase [Flavobacterium sp.]MBP7470833.1 TlpA family protein disulfide reductase [Flavobacterium sp.]
MKYLLCLIFPLLFSNIIVAQKVAVFDNYSTLEKEILSDKNSVYVVNFWATWCGPCVKELPYFEQLNSENINVKVVLVSLDFKNQFESKLIPFLKKKNIKSQVVFLSDSNYNAWLPLVDKDWSGSIPATLIIKNGKKTFVEKAFSSYQELNDYVNKIIN